jgi:putative ABC transport system substrate-binding protein
LGYVEDRNYVLEYRSADGNAERFPALADELVRLGVDLIVARGTPAARAAKNATETIPIVMAAIGEPLGVGVVESLARPGGNLTGFTNFEYPIGGKWLQLLKDSIPRLARVGVLFNPEDPSNVRYLRAAEALAPALGIGMVQIVARTSEEIEPAINGFARAMGDGLLIFPSNVSSSNRDRIVAQIGLHRLPAIYPSRFYTADGGLMSYGPDPVDLHARAASYADRILRGEKAGDLPVQQPTKFEFIINLKTAKALNLDIPPGVLAIVDEVIE